MATFEQTNLQGFLNRLNSNSLTAQDQALLTQALTIIIAGWGNTGISVDPNVGTGTDPAPVDDIWFAILYAEALGASTGGSLTPASWTVPAWFVDPSGANGGSDANAGTSAAAPLKTWARLQALWGTSSPVLRQTTTVTFLSSHVDNTDPVVWTPLLVGNGCAVLQGANPVPVPTVFTRSAARNRAAGANSLLAGSFSVGVPAAGLLVQNLAAGKSSRAWIYKSVGGGNFAMTQPLAPQTPPFPAGATLAQVNTWATGDAVQLLTPIAVNVVEFVPTLADFVLPSFLNCGFLYQLTLFDPQGAGTDNVFLGCLVKIFECNTQRTIVVSGAPGQPLAGFALQCINDFNNGGMVAVANGVQSFGGCITNAATQAGSTWGGGAGQHVWDDDFILGGFATCPLGGAVGPIFLDTGGGIIVNNGDLLCSANAGSGIAAIVYGAGASTFLMRGTSRLCNTTGNTFVATLTAPGTITGVNLNGGTAAHSVISGAPDVFNGGIATTPANLDAAAGAAGFGGLAFVPGGASIANTI